MRIATRPGPRALIHAADDRSRRLFAVPASEEPFAVTDEVHDSRVQLIREVRQRLESLRRGPRPHPGRREPGRICPSAGLASGRQAADPPPRAVSSRSRTSPALRAPSPGGEGKEDQGTAPSPDRARTTQARGPRSRPVLLAVRRARDRDLRPCRSPSVPRSSSSLAEEVAGCDAARTWRCPGPGRSSAKGRRRRGSCSSARPPGPTRIGPEPLHRQGGRLAHRHDHQGDGPGSRRRRYRQRPEAAPPREPRPAPREVAYRPPFLERQIAISARVPLPPGQGRGSMLLETALPMGRLRGKWHRYRGIPAVVTYHPSYLLRTPPPRKMRGETCKCSCRPWGSSPPPGGRAEPVGPAHRPREAGTRRGSRVRRGEQARDGVLDLLDLDRLGEHDQPVVGRQVRPLSLLPGAEQDEGGKAWPSLWAFSCISRRSGSNRDRARRRRRSRRRGATRGNARRRARRRSQAGRGSPGRERLAERLLDRLLDSTQRAFLRSTAGTSNGARGIPPARIPSSRPYDRHRPAARRRRARPAGARAAAPADPERNACRPSGRPPPPPWSGSASSGRSASSSR